MMKQRWGLDRNNVEIPGVSNNTTGTLEQKKKKKNNNNNSWTLGPSNRKKHPGINQLK